MPPPHGVYPAAPREPSTSYHTAEPRAAYPPVPPCPAAPPPIARPPTYATIVSAGTIGLLTVACRPVAGLKKLSDQVFPTPGTIAERWLVRWLPISPPTCSSTARRAGSLKNP